MRKSLFFLMIAVFFSTIAVCQSSLTLPAGTASCSPSSACLSCPGSDWNNPANVTLLDGIPADVDLMQKSFCFQSTCYYSRGLISSQFGFSIPSTATITGLEVSITRMTPTLNTVGDTSVIILQNGITSSSNYMSPSYWPTTYSVMVYGGPSDLWGLSWTPSDINSPATAVRLGIYNKSAASVSGVNVDYVSMTVYYSTITGIIESQSSGQDYFSVYEDNEKNISFNFSSLGGSVKLNIMDLMGKLISTTDIETVNGPNKVAIPGQDLTGGIYLAQVLNGPKIITKKIVIR